MEKTEKTAGRESAAKVGLATARSLPIALLRARERVMGPIRAMLADAGVTEQQWRVLRVLDENGAMDPTEIAERSCLLLPSLTRILQALSEKGYVNRTPHPTDGRRLQITITSAGHDFIASNMAEAERITARLRDHLGADKLDTLLDLLNELDGLRL
ncbi:homoprotocatechuate degradation operon regulator HpaR [Oricola thermophila]|uniref:Homoprotocatechuate degradation operon regulator HpaR n=1 Tax=Oricola thermophila TaxID=2742145 RepID=A0A6N1VLK6_9HYPH|nr:homoprotocatechuate degradation operon regulator HpaR [Oricola thermophila]QKV20302.1 homoprotocatechuate degradation operon regulator HpaR [Oricola thermophila]